MLTTKFLGFGSAVSRNTGAARKQPLALFRHEDEGLQQLVAERYLFSSPQSLATKSARILACDSESTTRVLYFHPSLRLVSALSIKRDHEGGLLLCAPSLGRHARAIGAGGMVLIHHHPDQRSCRDEFATTLHQDLIQMEERGGLNVFDSYLVSGAGWFSEKFGFWMPSQRKAVS